MCFNLFWKSCTCFIIQIGNSLEKFTNHKSSGRSRTHAGTFPVAERSTRTLTLIRDLKIAVYGKRLTSRNSFVIKSKLWTVKCSSHTIYNKNLKCCTKTPCMTTETLSLMGNSLGHPSLDVRACDVWRWQWTAVTLPSRPIVKWKRQTAQVKRQAMWEENHLISTVKFL